MAPIVSRDKVFMGWIPEETAAPDRGGDAGVSRRCELSGRQGCEPALPCRGSR